MQFWVHSLKFSGIIPESPKNPNLFDAIFFSCRKSVFKTIFIERQCRRRNTSLSIAQLKSTPKLRILPIEPVLKNRNWDRRVNGPR